MNDPQDIAQDIEVTAVAVREPGKLEMVRDGEKNPAPAQAMTAAQHRVVEVNEALLPAFQKAGNLPLSKDEGEKLMARFEDAKVSARPHDGLLYIEHIHIARRLNEVFGPMQWTMIRRREWVEGNRVYAEWVMVIRGAYAGESVGAMDYHPSNAKMNYSDALEGTRGEAIRRIAGKYLSCGDQVWEKTYCEEWKARQRAPQRPAPAPAAPAPRREPAPTAPAPAPAPARPAATAPAAPKADFDVVAWLENCKAKLIALATQHDPVEWWAYAVREGWILDTERLEDAPASKMFPAPTEAGVKLAFEQGRTAVALKNATPEDVSAYDAAMQSPPTAPAPAKAPAPKAPAPAAKAHSEPGDWWRDVEIHFGRNKGTKLGEMDKNTLYGWCMNYTVTESFEKDGKTVMKRPETVATETKLRNAFDAAKEHYGFTEKD